MSFSDLDGGQTSSMGASGRSSSQFGTAQFLFCHDPISLFLRKTLRKERFIEQTATGRTRLAGTRRCHVPPRTSAGRRHTASFSGQNKRTHTQEVTSESTWKRGDSQRGGSYLLAAFLEHVLLFLRHQLPLFAAQHHALRAGDVLHVDHQLGAVQRVAVAAQTHATVSRQLSVASCECAATLATVGGTHGGGLVGRPSNLSFSCRSALVRTERTWSSELASG